METSEAYILDKAARMGLDIAVEVDKCMGGWIERKRKEEKKEKKEEFKSF